MLTEKSAFEYWLNRWEGHPARFEYWHPWFWRIIDGEALEGGPPIAPHFTPTPISPPGRGSEPPIHVNPSPPYDPPVHHDPPSHHNPPSPPGHPGVVTPASVPEPESYRLLLLSAGLILVLRGGSRCLKLFPSRIKGRSAALG